MEWYQYPVTRGFLWLWSHIINHSGIDYGAPCGTPLTSPVDGTVLHAAQHPWGGQIDILVDNLPGYGRGPHVVTFLHGISQYVLPGDKVTRGQILGESGQPPPGAGFGSGCHVHFEVTHGDTAPYTTYSPGKNPNEQHYPESPAPLVASLPHSLGDGGGGHIGAESASIPMGDCGPEPIWQGDPFTFPQWLNAHNIWEACAKGKAPSTNPLDIIASGVTGISSNLGAIGSFFADIAQWVSVRGIKMLVGISLVVGSLFLAFLPEVFTAVGLPELAGAARKGGVRGAIAIPAGIRGVRRRAEREEKRRFEASAHRRRAEAREKTAQEYIAALTAAKATEREHKRQARATTPLDKIIPAGAETRDIPPGSPPTHRPPPRLAKTARPGTMGMAQGNRPQDRPAPAKPSKPTRGKKSSGSALPPGSFTAAQHGPTSRLKPGQKLSDLLNQPVDTSTEEFAHAQAHKVRRNRRAQLGRVFKRVFRR